MSALYNEIFLTEQWLEWAVKNLAANDRNQKINVSYKRKWSVSL